ncbi:hypothetical protein [Corynebacterium epidermidicanis]|uniref:Uncharacterized protein n=1 Tax=Corynebacterium epidermidicanis TaxID=1050174 RepID=A0A0G3GSS6_9CORY|nr:hypothetical protein [Corynebacterium epidermidicanis]AKK04154.1 hypothetical protein CEPID_11630 [Corynebacterium epidermidicanis]
MRKLGGSLVIITAGLLLAGCGGGATVDNQAATAVSVAPLSKAPLASTSASVSPSATASPRQNDAPVGAAPRPRDEAAVEISALPSDGPKRTDSESKYLDELKKQGIRVEGIEDQMLGAASQVCLNEKDNYLIGAIAGQVVEQKRTDKKPAEVADIITKAAKDGYC